jgi:hypothetical protein
VSPLRTGLAAAAALAGAAYLALGTGPFLRWLAAAGLLLAAWELRPLLAGRDLPRLRRAAPYLVLGALVLALLGELLLGHPPATRDHAIHYFQTELLVHDLVPAGHLRGWSDRLGNGYTLGDSYPVLGYLWMGAAHLLSFGLVPLRVSYAWGIFGMWLLAVGGVWRLAAAVTAEILPDLTNSTDGQKSSPASIAAWAGCLGAALWLLDPGASREGGWEYLMFHGVWPQLLATSLWVASLPPTLAAFRAPSPRRIAVAGGLLGLSLLAHPFALLMAGSSAAAWALLLLLRPPDRDLPAAGRGLVFLAVHGLAGLIAAGWIAGFLASAHTMGRTPVPWLPWGELATRLVAGELFAAHRAWLGPLALLGLGLALRRGAALAWLTAGLLLATLVLASDAAITVLRLDLLVSAFKNLQFPRYAIVLKPLWCALAGVGAAWALTMLLRRGSHESEISSTSGQEKSSLRESSTESQQFRRNLAIWAGCLLLAPVLAGVVEDRTRLTPRPVGGLGTLEGSVHGEVEAELRALLAAERAAGPLKLAFLRQRMGGGTYPIFAATDLGAGLVLDGHIPSINSIYRVQGRSPAALAALGVTHVLHDRPLGKKDQALAAALAPVGKAGPYTLARLTAATPPRTLAGVATWSAPDLRLTATRRGAHALDLEVSNITAPATLQLLATPDRHWQATFVGDGPPQPLEPAPANVFADLTGTRVTVPGPGRVELRWQPPARERALGWLGLAAALAALLALGRSRPLAVAERLHGPAARRLSRALAALTLAALLALAVRRQHQQLARTWAPALGQARFVADLVDAGRVAVTTHPADACDGLAGRDARAGCSEAAERPRRATLYRDPFLFRCLSVAVPPRGRSVLRFDVPEGARVLGALVRQTAAGKRNKKLAYKAARARVALGDRLERFEAAHTLELHNGSGEPERVCVAAAAVE